jgi:hypothetical protein
VKTVLILLALLLAGGLWWLLGDRGTGGSGDAQDVVVEENLSPEEQYLRRGSEAVTLWVKTPDGRVPPLAELGLRHNGKTRWLNADEHGRRVFLGAPIGTIEVVAKAPGYEEKVERLTIEAGFMNEMTLMIRERK